MIRTVFLVLTVMLLLPTVVWTDELSPIYSAMQTSQPPHLDGVLDDACWQTAEKTAPMTLVNGKELDIKTQGMVCWDRRNLYIALICPEPLMPELEKRIANKSLMPMEDGVEIFIDSDHDHVTFLQLRADVLGNHESYKDYVMDAVLNTKWSTAASRNADGWTVEAAIPLEVAGTVSSSKAVWGLNLNRQRLLAPEQRYTYWSDTHAGFQIPARFGHLIFADYSTWLRAYYDSKTALLKAQIGKLSASYPTSAASINNQLSQQEESYMDFLGAVSTEKIDSGAKCMTFISTGESCAAQYEKSLFDLRLSIIENEFHQSQRLRNLGDR